MANRVRNNPALDGSCTPQTDQWCDPLLEVHPWRRPVCPRGIAGGRDEAGDEATIPARSKERTEQYGS
eukprot:11636935-Alexandrium_andersonii.AAC.1